MKVSIIGTGTMGSGIAQAFAQSSITVNMFGISQSELDKGMNFISKSLEKLVSKAKISEEQKNSVISNIKPILEYDECRDSDLVIEAVSEDIRLKTTIFKNLDNLCESKTIFASNTSSLSITEIAASVNRQDKVVGMHFFNPAPVMKLVEVIKARETSEATALFVHDIALKIGKTPVMVNEAPGFVVNRILIPMINEAIGILAERVASASDIDQAMQLGANHPIGPLALGDLIGLDVCLAIMEVLHDEFGEDKYRPHVLLRNMVRAGKLGRKSGEGFYKYK
jgi:3-hydroxybutyryl-CoA dehydrogenase